MSPQSFRALVVEEGPEKTYTREIREQSVSDLPEGEVLVRVKYSSLNYKDALSASGNRGVTKSYPHTPGIDAAGVVEESRTDAVQKGDEVIVTSYDLGMNTPGGFGEYIRVPAGWVVPLPEGLSLRDSMVYGTAGFTAAMSVTALLGHGLRPADGPVQVTGGSGGVGSLATAFLAKEGFHVSVVTGKSAAADLLTRLGAGEIRSRQEAADEPKRPLLKGTFAGCVDTVGGELLAACLKSTAQHGAVTCCGNAADASLSLTVYPFILRGIALYGIDSQNCPMEKRRALWKKIAGPWRLNHPDSIAQEIPLADVGEVLDEMLAGNHIGRTVVHLDS